MVSAFSTVPSEVLAVLEPQKSKKKKRADLPFAELVGTGRS